MKRAALLLPFALAATGVWMPVPRAQAEDACDPILEEAVTPKPKPLPLKGRSIDCDHLAKLSNSKTAFLLNKILVDGGAKAVTMASTGSLDTERGRRSAIADGGWILIHDAAATGLDYYLVKSGVPLSSALVARYGEALGEWVVKKPYNKAILGPYDKTKDGGASLGDKMANTDLAFQAMRIPASYGIDRGILNSLPGLMQKLCKINPALMLVVNQGIIRFVDRSVTSVSQTLFQQAILGDDFKAKE